MNGSNPIETFIAVEDLVDCENNEDPVGVDEVAVAVKNPNRGDSRRLFQKRIADFNWDCSIPYKDQPKRLDDHGPEELLFPDHFYQAEGGIVVIYWENDRSTGCLCSIINVNEEAETFTFRVFNVQRKSKKT